MFSYAVGNNVLQLVFSLLVLCVGGAAEELLPKFFCVGFPVLLSAVIAISSKQALVGAVLFAIAAGGVEDSLSSLPLMTSVSYFVIVALVVRRIELSYVAFLVSYPAYQVWIAAWTGSLGASVFLRFLIAIPIGVATVALTSWLVGIAERRAAIGEQD
jgi:hypothetical protein